MDELLCPIHKSLDDAGKLEPLDNCIACIRAQRDELKATIVLTERALREISRQAADHPFATDIAILAQSGLDLEGVADEMLWQKAQRRRHRKLAEACAAFEEIYGQEDAAGRDAYSGVFELTDQALKMRGYHMDWSDAMSNPRTDKDDPKTHPGHPPDCPSGGPPPTTQSEPPPPTDPPDPPR